MSKFNIDGTEVSGICADPADYDNVLYIDGVMTDYEHVRLAIPSGTAYLHDSADDAPYELGFFLEACSLDMGRPHGNYNAYTAEEWAQECERSEMDAE